MTNYHPPRQRRTKSGPSPGTGWGPGAAVEGNSQVPKGDGDAPVQAYIWAIPVKGQRRHLTRDVGVVVPGGMGA